jgi:hypothetical protein
MVQACNWQAFVARIRKEVAAHPPSVRADLSRGLSGEQRDAHRQAGGAFLPDEGAAQTTTMSTASVGVNDPVTGRLGPPSGQGTGVVHTIAGSLDDGSVARWRSAQSAARSMVYGGHVLQPSMLAQHTSSWITGG